MQWAGPAEVKEWVSSLLADAKGALIIVKALVNESTAQTVGSFYVRDKGLLSWRTLEQFQTRARWEEAAAVISKVDNPSADEKRTFGLLQASLKRWQSGIEDTAPDAFQDDEDGQTD
jgi:hypothetical protein